MLQYLPSGHFHWSLSGCDQPGDCDGDGGCDGAHRCDGDGHGEGGKVHEVAPGVIGQL